MDFYTGSKLKRILFFKVWNLVAMCPAGPRSGPAILVEVT